MTNTSMASLRVVMIGGTVAVLAAIAYSMWVLSATGDAAIAGVTAAAWAAWLEHRNQRKETPSRSSS